MKDQRKNVASQNALDILNWCELEQQLCQHCEPNLQQVFTWCLCVIATGEQTASTRPRKTRLTASGMPSGCGRLPGGGGICSGPWRSDWILTNRKARDR